MDYIESLDIELEKDHYYAGDVLKGWVTVSSLCNVKVRGISVTVRGRAQVEWKVAKNGAIYTLHNCQLLFDNKIVIWGQDKKCGSAIPVLNKGHHRLPFNFQLPDADLPCSFESKLGNIRYYLHVHMDIPYASPPQGMRYFTVIGRRVESPQEAWMVPITIHKQEQTFCITCSRGCLGLDVSMGRSAFCCGENIPMQIEVTNGVNAKVWPLVQMVQRVEFVIDKSHFEVKKELEHVIWEYKGPLVHKHSTMRLENLSLVLQIPVMPPTTISGCDLIHISYQIKVRLVTTKWGDALNVELPILIGTIPTTGKERSYLTRVASMCAEGGMYISPELQIGQVYDGGADLGSGGGSAEGGKVLYQPVYICVPHKKVTLKNGTNSSAKMALARGARGRSSNGSQSEKDVRSSKRKVLTQPPGATEVELPPTWLTSL